ncbi:type III polyketide synthase [Aurantiacibacter gangjinensis]|uniref:Uncharacterized protein n=1 Tax=Aurantiacibacter gangjinensis TaxID=502682 RepID=A0A0G9MPL8_9SPHN|nr:type III polyketide synthase [Aurantiacibacter gangjinensis]APE28418.1 Chalcone synthase [Aurantiacibacter gangjinensis]KLE32640.1 hypothetical protein AAW01_00815 [Aurantiacibacter gangjinensis]
MDRVPQPVTPRINAIGTAVPAADVHQVYSDWARRQLEGTREAAMLDRMIGRGGIAHRHSVLSGEDAQLVDGSFYASDLPAGTGERMRRFAEHAPDLAVEAAGKLPSLEGITHIIVASCTGFMAPGLDQVLARRLGLASDVQRLSIGFMGCYAGVTLLRTAGQIVRAEPDARVLAISVELCTLHMQETTDIGALLAMGQFADGAAAAIVSSYGEGLALGQSISATLDDSDELITWTITDTGFLMHLSGEVPGRLSDAFARQDLRARLKVDANTSLAVHPGGKSILDAVERGLGLPSDALEASRSVLHDYGNMSSASVIFVLEKLAATRPERGIALAFGPGLAMEGLHFGWTGDA